MTEALTKKEQTRKRMLQAAGQSFRQHGYAGIGVDGIAKAAGVTSGAFYAHLGSKNAAFEAAVVAGLEEVIENVPIFQQDHGKDWVKAFADYYLGKAHREDLSCGCAMASLTSEVVRAEGELHQIYENKMKKIASLIAEGLAGKGPGREDRAWAMLGTLIGGLNVARAMKNEDSVEIIASSIKSAAITAAGETQ